MPQAPKTQKSGLFARLYALWQLAKHEHASPSEIGRAVAVGVFAGCTPAVGFHGGIAVGLATLLRLNRLWAFLGSRVCTFAILPWIALSEVEVAHRLRTGTWAALDVRTVMHEAPGLLADWLLGAGLVGSVLAVLLGALAYAVALRYHTVPSTGRADLAPSVDHPTVTPPGPASMRKIPTS